MSRRLPVPSSFFPGVSLALLLGMTACVAETTPHTLPAPAHSFTDEELDAIRELTRDAEKEACEKLALEPPLAGEGVQLTLGARFDAYTETEVCRFVQVGAGGMNISGQQVRYSEGSHHMLILSTSYTELPTADINGNVFDTAEGRIFDCSDGPGEWAITGVVGGSQNPEWDPIPLPDGVAAIVPEGAWLLINLHMLNPTPEAVDVCVKTNFATIPAEEVEQEAGVLFWYNPFISVNPQGTGKATLRCPITQDISLVNAQSHMHARGSHYTADLYDEDGNLVQRLFESSDWETPVPADYEPVMQIPAGSSIEFTCEYTNPQDRTVNQGGTTIDEMCMFIGQYYPRDTMLDNCGPDVGFVTLGTPIYEGTQTGEETLECWLEAEAIPGQFTSSQQDCITTSCAAPEVWEYLVCAYYKSESCAESCQVRSNMTLYTEDCMGACESEMADAEADCTTSALMESNASMCTTHTPMTTYEAACDAKHDTFGETCRTGACATECVDLEGEDCLACQLTCVHQKTDTCVEDWVGECVTALVTECVTEAASACIEPCVVDTVTKCATECVNTVLCADNYDSVLAATCD